MLVYSRLQKQRTNHNRMLLRSNKRPADNLIGPLKSNEYLASSNGSCASSFALLIWLCRPQINWSPISDANDLANGFARAAHLNLFGATICAHFSGTRWARRCLAQAEAETEAEMETRKCLWAAHNKSNYGNWGEFLNDYRSFVGFSWV